MSVQAAMTGDVDLLKHAVLHDPLVGAICTPDEVWQMVDEMLVAQAQWLPQYADAIPAAARAAEDPQGQDPRLAGRRPPRRPHASRSSAPAPAPRRAKATASAPS